MRLFAGLSLKKSFYVKSIHYIWVTSSLNFLPINPPSLTMLFLDKSMHFILGMLNISSISLSHSSVIPLSLKHRVLIHGNNYKPSISSFIPVLENFLFLNPDKSIFSSIWWGATAISFFFLSPFLGASPFGNLKNSTASPNDSATLLPSGSVDFLSSPTIESSPNNYPRVEGIWILRPVSFSYLEAKYSMIFFYSSNFVYSDDIL